MAGGSGDSVKAPEQALSKVSGGRGGGDGGAGGGSSSYGDSSGSGGGGSGGGQQQAAAEPSAIIAMSASSAVNANDSAASSAISAPLLALLNAAQFRTKRFGAAGAQPAGRASGAAQRGGRGQAQGVPPVPPREEDAWGGVRENPLLLVVRSVEGGARGGEEEGGGGGGARGAGSDAPGALVRSAESGGFEASFAVEGAGGAERVAGGGVDYRKAATLLYIGPAAGGAGQLAQDDEARLGFYSVKGSAAWGGPKKEW